MVGMGPGFYTGMPNLETAVTSATAELKAAKPKPKEDPALRSAAEMLGYHIEAGHGPMGHVDDFIIDDDGWIIRYLSIDTRNWLPGKRVLVAPLWVREISWPEQKIYVDLDRETIKESPAYDPYGADYPGVRGAAQRLLLQAEVLERSKKQ